MSNSKNDKRVYAGYYKRYDGKLFYVVTMAKDGVTGEDMVIYMPYSIRNDENYLTISKKQFCEPVMVDGKLRARYKRQTQMRIEQDFIDSLENDLLPTPKRKRVPRPDEEKYREYRTATNYYDYAKDLCVNYLVDLRKYKFSKNYYDDFIALSKKEMEIVYEDLKFIKTCFQTVLRDYAEFFNERFIKRLSIRKYAEAHNMNRGSVENIQRKMQGIGTGLLVLFFVIGVVKTCGSFTDLKKPEHAVKLFVRFILAKAVVTQGMELMTTLFGIVQSAISQIMTSAGVSSATDTVLPDELVSAIENCGFWESIPLWAVTLIGGLFITVMSFIMIMSVYGRFFKLYMYTAIAPIPLSTFAGEPTQNVGKSFLKSYCAVCLEGAVIVLACIIFCLTFLIYSFRISPMLTRDTA